MTAQEIVGDHADICRLKAVIESHGAKRSLNASSDTSAQCDTRVPSWGSVGYKPQMILDEGWKPKTEPEPRQGEGDPLAPLPLFKVGSRPRYVPTCMTGILHDGYKQRKRARRMQGAPEGQHPDAEGTNGADAALIDTTDDPEDGKENFGLLASPLRAAGRSRGPTLAAVDARC